MPLKLTITNCQTGKEETRLIEKGTITIGRSEEMSDWILVNPEHRVSKRHCRIEYQNGDYFITDTHSANGTFIHGQRLQPDKPRRINDGDSVTLCAHPPVYELRVSITKQSPEETPPWAPQEPLSKPSQEPPANVRWWEEPSGQPLPPPQEPSTDIWWKEADAQWPTRPQAPCKTPQRPSQPPTGETAEAVLRAFLDGADLPELPIAAADVIKLFHNLGKLFRQTIQGLHELLQARSAIKAGFKIPQYTVIGSVKRNPLKSMEVKLALEQFLTDKNPNCLASVQALQEVLFDLKAHELALMAGIRAALNHLLKRFEPDNLELHISKHSILDNIVPANRKAKYWDEFTRLYAEIVEEAEDNFRKLFEGEFERAYEQQVQQLHPPAGESS